MKIVFSDTRIKEYLNGTFHVHNTGLPIDAPSGMLSDILAASVKLDNEKVQVFAIAKETDPKKASGK